MAAGGAHLSKEFFELVKSIGESRSKQEEDKIIIHEVSSLKVKMAAKDVTPKKMREYLMRMIYVEMLGHDASFGHIHAVQMANSKNILEKRMGYLAVCLVLNPDHSFMLLLINTIQKDLRSDNTLEVSMALNVVCKLVSAETVPALLPLVVKLLDHKEGLVKKKAVMGLHRFHSLDPTSTAPLNSNIRKALCDSNISVMFASLHLLHDLATAKPAAYKDLIPDFVSILKQVIEHRLPRDYDYHRMPAPWIQLKLLQILAVLGQADKGASEGMYEVLHEVIKRADVGINVGYAIVYECVRTITSIYPDQSLIEDAALSISRFITSENHNLKYLGVTALASIVQIDPKYAAEHQLVVIDCFPEADHRILTDRGMQFLDQIEARLARGEKVLYGCYDIASKTLCYSEGKLVFSQPRRQLLAFNSPGEARRWTDGSGSHSKGGLPNDEELKSRHLSLRVSFGHTMYVQQGLKPYGKVAASALYEAACPCPQPKEGQLDCEHRRRRIRMLACAENGHAVTDSSKRAEVQADLQLDEDQFTAFLQLLGFWLGDGSMWYHSDYNAISFNQVKTRDRPWLKARLQEAGLVAGVDFRHFMFKKEEIVLVLHPLWFRQFDREFGKKYKNSAYFAGPVDGQTAATASSSLDIDLMAEAEQADEGRIKLEDDDDHDKENVVALVDLTKEEDKEVLCGPPAEMPAGWGVTWGPGVQPEPFKSVKWLPSWMLMELPPEELCLVIEGLRRADGNWAWGGKAGDIFTSGLHFRDQLMQALLHCGFSPYPHLRYVKGTIRGYRWHDQRVDRKTHTIKFVSGLSQEDQQNYKPIIARANAWTVSWTAPDCQAGKGSCWPSMPTQGGIVKQDYVAQRDGRIWSVEVTHSDHLIFAQRAERDGSGNVTTQSRPVITGNCLEDPDETLKRKTLDLLYCFPASCTRVLTNHGFLFLDEIQQLQARRVAVLFAAFDVATKCVQYVRQDGPLVLPVDPSPPLVSFTAVNEKRRWTAASGVYGHLTRDGMTTNHVSLLVTAEHRMYVKLGVHRTGTGVSWETKTGQEKPPTVMDARSLLDASGGPAGQHGVCVGVSCIADGGVAHPSTGVPADVLLKLQLDDNHVHPFLALYGYWLGDGSMTYAGPTGGYNAVQFSPNKAADKAWVDEQLQLVGLEASEWRSYDCANGQRVFLVTAARWFEYFDDEYGCKYAGSSKVSPPVHGATLMATEAVSSSTVSSRAPDGVRTGRPTKVEQLMRGITGAVSAADRQRMYRKRRTVADRPADSSSSAAGAASSSIEGVSASYAQGKSDNAGLNEPTTEDGSTPEEVKSAKWFWWWVLRRLGKEHLRILLDGYRRAAGTWARRADQGEDARSGNLWIYTSSVKVRDELVVACLHAGYSAFFELHHPAGPTGEYYSIQDGVTLFTRDADEASSAPDTWKAVIARHPAWRVCYAEATSRPGHAACFPALRLQNEVTAEKSHGPVWCVRVKHPDHLIIAQRAERHGGIVTKASRPMITGNSMTNPQNVTVVVDKLIGFLKAATDNYMRIDLLSRISQLAEKYAPSNDWFVTAMNNMMELAGEQCKPEYAHNVMKLIIDNASGNAGEEDIREFAVDTYLHLLATRKVLPDLLVQVSAWVIGEYGHTSRQSDAVHQLHALMTAMDRTGPDQAITKGWIISAMLKIVARHGSVPAEVQEIVLRYQNSQQVDLQQRAHEFLELVKAPALLQAVLPTDQASVELIVDEKLSFLDGYVNAALQAGAKPYQPRSQFGLHGVERKEDGGLKFAAYDKPQTGHVGHAQPAAQPQYPYSNTDPNAPGSFFGPPGTVGYNGQQPEIASATGLPVKERKWGPKGFNNPQKEAPQQQQSYGGQPANVAGGPPMQHDQYGGQQAPPGGGYEPQHVGPPGGGGGGFGGGRQRGPPPVSEKEKLASSLFAGMSGSASAGGGGGSFKRPSPPTAAPGQPRVGASHFPGGAQPPSAQQPQPPKQVDLLGGMFDSATGGPAQGQAKPPSQNDLVGLFGAQHGGATGRSAPQNAAGGTIDLLGAPSSPPTGGGGGFDLLAGGGGDAFASVAPSNLGLAGASPAIQQQLAPLPKSSPSDLVVGSDVRLQVSFLKAYGNESTTIAVFVSNKTQQPINNVTLPLSIPGGLSGTFTGDPSPSARPGQTAGTHNVTYAVLAPGQTISLLMNLSVRELTFLSSASLSVSGQVAVAGGASTVSFSIPLDLTDLLRPAPMTTPQYGGFWRQYTDEAKVAVRPSSVSQPTEYMARVQQMRLFPVQTIGQECIASGRLVTPAGQVGAQNLALFVHGKVATGGVDVTVRSKSQQLSQALIKQVQQSMK